MILTNLNMLTTGPDVLRGRFGRPILRISRDSPLRLIHAVSLHKQYGPCTQEDIFGLECAFQQSVPLHGFDVVRVLACELQLFVDVLTIPTRCSLNNLSQYNLPSYYISRTSWSSLKAQLSDVANAQAFLKIMAYIAFREIRLCSKRKALCPFHLVSALEE